MGLFGGGEDDVPGFVREAQINASGVNQLQNALIRFLASGQSQPVSFGGASGMFPQGTSLQALGFQGNVVPPAGPLLESAFQQAGQLGQGPQNQATLAQLSKLVSGQPAGELDPTQREAFFKNAISGPAMQRFERETIPAILARFGSGGQTGAIREELARAGTDLQTNLAGIQSGLLRDDERLRLGLADTAQQRSLSAIGALQQAQAFPISVQAQIGDLQRSILGQQNQEALFQALLGTPYGDPRLSLLPLVGGASTVSSPTVGAGGNPLSGLLNLGAAFGGGGLGSLIGGLF